MRRITYVVIGYLVGHMAPLVLADAPFGASVLCGMGLALWCNFAVKP